MNIKRFFTVLFLVVFATQSVGFSSARADEEIVDLKAKAQKKNAKKAEVLKSKNASKKWWYLGIGTVLLAGGTGAALYGWPRKAKNGCDSTNTAGECLTYKRNNIAFYGGVAAASIGLLVLSAYAVTSAQNDLTESVLDARNTDQLGVEWAREFQLAAGPTAELDGGLVNVIYHF